MLAIKKLLKGDYIYLLIDLAAACLFNTGRQLNCLLLKPAQHEA